MPLPKRMLPMGLSLAGALVVGWWMAASLAPDTAARGNRTVMDRQVDSLLSRMDQEGDLSRDDRQRLLMHFLELGRLQEAQLMLEPWLEEQPRSLALTLLMADLRRLNNDPTRARRDLNHLLRLHPDHPRILELRTLIDQEQQRGGQALKEITQRFNARPEGQRMELGLLLADLYRQLGQNGRSVSLYRQLADETPQDARPVLALAMLRQEQGQAEEVLSLLDSARQRRQAGIPSDGLIDALAARWGLSASRIRVAGSEAQQAAAETP